MCANNRLINEKSPYLLQHADNPVDWHAWGDEPFQRARKEDKPVFLSIGYATCHWCHVMAHESFEDEEVANLLNQHYVAVKVDREERPDVDKIYMLACQALTGRGGWPLSVFTTPEGKPFFAGSYFPKQSRMQMPGFMDILRQIAVAWKSDRDRILKSSDEVAKAIAPVRDASACPTIGKETLEKGCRQLAANYDRKWGGFSKAPKFPTPHQLTFLLRWYKRNGDPDAVGMITETLTAMRMGGIFDQIGFGFHRYSVDEQWLVPHFEKMLYDQALHAMAYLEAYQVTGKTLFAETVKEIFTYVLRDMTSPKGGFYSAEDADSEGREGLFYVWKSGEVKQNLGEEKGDLVCRFYGISDSGNFEEGLSIPHISTPAEVFASGEGMDLKQLENAVNDGRNILFEVRRKRVHPLKDDKILTSWNGLMIAALAKGYQVFRNPRHLKAAEDAASFIMKNLKASDGRLLRRYCRGDAAYPAFLDDYAFLVWGLIELYETTFTVSYLEDAVRLNKAMIEIFWDEAGGGLCFTGEGNEPLITRSKEIYDGALPSGNSVAALNFMRLSRLTGTIELERMAEEIARAFSGQVADLPMGYTQFLNALDFMMGPDQEIVIAGDPDKQAVQAMIRTVHRRFLPNKVLLLRPSGPAGDRLVSMVPFLEAMGGADGEPRVYICELHSCKAPVNDPAKLEAALD